MRKLFLGVVICCVFAGIAIYWRWQDRQTDVDDSKLPYVHEVREEESAHPHVPEVPSPQPSLILTLNPERLIESALKKEDQLKAVLTPLVTPTVPQGTPETGTLSQLDVTMTEKRKPVVHYYIAGKPEHKIVTEEKDH